MVISVSFWSIGKFLNLFQLSEQFHGILVYQNIVNVPTI